MKPTIVLADDHELLRSGLKSILEEDLDATVVGQASNGIEAVALVSELTPDIVILDVHMPVMNGMDAAREIRKSSAKTKVIAVSMERDSKFVSEMFLAGAHAYIIKHAAVDELEGAIRAVLDGRRYISADITGTVIDDYLRLLEAETPATGDLLTARERQVLQLIAEGQSTKEIAALMHISNSTVETHRQHIMEKLDEHCVAGLTKAAIRMGLTTL